MRFVEKTTQKNYPTNKTDVYHIDDIWSLDVLDLKDYGPENKRGHRYVLVVVDNFSNLGWTIPFKKSSQTKKDSFEKFLINSKREPKLIETDREKEFSHRIFRNFLNNHNFKHYSRKTSVGAVFLERFELSIRYLLKKAVFEREDGNWIAFLPTITKQCNNRVPTSTKLTPVQASLKKTEVMFTKNYWTKERN